MQPEVARRDILQTLTIGGVTVTLSGCEMSLTTDRDENQTDTPMQSPEQQTDERQQPIENGRFKVKIDDTEVSGFQHVTVPGSTTETVDGGDSDQQRRLLGQTEYEDLVMERNVIKGDSTLRDWRDDIRQGKIESARKTVSVVLLTETGETVIEWQFTNAWVKEYDPPELVAGSTEVATESCTVAYDEMVREEP
jgi:phage tail-like protein